jgi:transcriptional regulator with XRE-family HTH domain
MSDFGITLKKLRREKNITQRDLANRVDVDFTYISKMENGKLENSPSEAIIRKIAIELDFDADKLILLANKIPENMRKTIVDDNLAIEFLRKMDDLSEEQRKKIREFIEKVNK